MSESFQLPDEYLQLFPDQYSRGPTGLSASMKAAADPDSRVLVAALARRDHFEISQEGRNDTINTFGPNSTVQTPGQEPINTPLLQAIRSQLPRNVNILLKSGADPNGIDVETLEMYQSLFLRFRPSIPQYVDIDGDTADRKTLLKCMELSQSTTITAEEIEERAHDITPFWMVSNLPALDTFPGGDEMHSLIAAARQPSISIFNSVLNAEADALSWTSEGALGSRIPTASSLAISSPLHAAVEANVSMIPHLLSLGFDPNFIPLSTPSTCLTPFMSTLIRVDTSSVVPRPVNSPSEPLPPALPSSFNYHAYTAFLSHTSPSLTLTTPILGIHAFHLAVAHGSLPLLKYVMDTLPIPPAYIIPTALGHTLLHIACLPPSVAHIRTRSLAVLKSIHDTRSLSYPRIHIITPAELGTARPRANSPPITRDEDDSRTAETALIDYLVSKLNWDVSRQDVFGNTALHYLASHSIPNLKSISLLRAVEGGEEAWCNISNRWGYSAKALFDSSEAEDEVQEYQKGIEKELRAIEKDRDEWWDRRLAKEWRQKYGVSGGARIRQATARGRGGRCGECGRKMDDSDKEFPYHVRNLT